MYSGNENPIALNYNSDGNLWIQLPQGPDYDGNKLYLFVNIIDDTFGSTVFNIQQPVVVIPNNNLADQLAATITSNDPNSPFLQDINSGNVNLVAKNVIALTSVFNIQALSGSQTQTQSNSSSSTSSSSSSSSPIQANPVNDQQASLREFLIGKVADLSVSDMSSIKVISSALSAASANTEQISRNAAVKFSNKFNFIYSFFLYFFFEKDKTVSKNTEMINYLDTLSNKLTFEDLKQGLNGIADSITNSLIVKFLLFYKKNIFRPLI